MQSHCEQVRFRGKALWQEFPLVSPETGRMNHEWRGGRSFGRTLNTSLLPSHH